MNPGPIDTGTLALDAQGLDRLRNESKRDPDRALGTAAKQFEALLLNMMLKSMRQATASQDGLFDNEQSRLYTSMFDQQISQHLANRGIGLADVMTRQLSAARGAAGAAAAAGAGETPAAAKPPALGTPRSARVPAAEGTAPGGGSAPAAPAAPASGPLPASRTREFVNRIWSHAVEAARATGIQPRFMVGQAALESGWGRNEMRAADGNPSHNLFGVKAGRGWNGPVVERTTTEYVNGEPKKMVEKFRVYSSYAEAFRDYAKLLTANRRYAGVVGQGEDAAAFARGLQQAGYATDPAYADKLERIINGPTLRASLRA